MLLEEWQNSQNAFSSILCVPSSWHVDVISKVQPFIKETFNGRYFELDFSENLAKMLTFLVKSLPFTVQFSSQL